MSLLHKITMIFDMGKESFKQKTKQNKAACMILLP